MTWPATMSGQEGPATLPTRGHSDATHWQQMRRCCKAREGKSNVFPPWLEACGMSMFNCSFKKGRRPNAATFARPAASARDQTDVPD